MQRNRSTTPTVVLMGLRGSGKSTLGAAVALLLGRPFVDLDDRTPGLLNSESAADAINAHGLAAFRDAECRALEAVFDDAQDGDMVVALGGGTPTAPGAGELLRRKAGAREIVLIYLHAEPGELRDRLSVTDAATRPSLTGEDMLDEIETIYLQRDGSYRALATRTIDSAALTGGRHGDTPAAAERLLDAIRDERE